MAKHENLVDLFQDMSTAIKDKTDTTGKIKLDDFPDKIREIQKPGYIVSTNNFDTPNHILGIDYIVNSYVNKYTSIDVSSASSLSSYVTCDVGDLIILCVAVRNPVTSLDSGWTTISTSNKIGNNQYVVWAYKYASSTKEEVTVKCSGSGRIYINMMAIGNGVDHATFTDNGFIYSGDNATGLYSEKPSGITIWCATIDIWGGSEWTTSNSGTMVSLAAGSQPRLMNFIDRSDAEDITINLPSGNTGKLLIGSLTINNITDFNMEVAV